MSAGGVLGGLFAALIAPLLFDWVYEHPLLILAAALLLPLPRLIAWDSAFALSPRRARILVALLVAIAGFAAWRMRSEEHTSEIQSLMSISYAGFCLKNKKTQYKVT